MLQSALLELCGHDEDPSDGCDYPDQQEGLCGDLVPLDHDPKGVGESGDDEREQDTVEHENAGRDRALVRADRVDNRRAVRVVVSWPTTYW